ncbi:AraC family transcriptional regulator [Sphingomonas flavalba]|uniref:AraC family transcriptional regulator n=1 Tax=Sphingomonas flavalba TaxID=2559804 RepID=UPI00109D9ADF|nr:AraC family transcriptional regulator [Sphingomonas flavalba]
MSALSLEYAAPDCDLRDFVSVFYDFRADLPLLEDSERADLAQFRFKLSPGEGSYRFADGTVQAAPETQIVGPTTGMTAVRAVGPVDLFGVGLLPAGWAALMGIDASTMVNRVVDAQALFGRRMSETAAQLRAASTLDARVAIGNTLIRALVAEAKDMPVNFTRIVDHWLERADSPDVETLVAEAGLSRRQVERLCKRFYGAPPKMLARKYRALRAAVALARGDTDMTSVIARGFYDQSHFIREIKYFTGITPSRFTDDLPTLARLTLKRGAVRALRPLITDT